MECPAPVEVMLETEPLTPDRLSKLRAIKEAQSGPLKDFYASFVASDYSLKLLKDGSVEPGVRRKPATSLHFGKDALEMLKRNHDQPIASTFTASLAFGVEGFNKLRDRVYDAEFQMLSRRWRRETKYSSLMSKAAGHPAYRRIISIGWPMVPFLLNDLKRQDPEHWFLALYEITGANPVLPAHRGDMRSVADDWLRWGRSRGLVE